MGLLPVTLEEQIAEVERECAMRNRLYPQWVNVGRMTQRKADRQIITMEAVLATLRGLAKAPDLVEQMTLFHVSRDPPSSNEPP